MKRLSISILTLVIAVSPAMGQGAGDNVGRTRISGLAFGDAYWMAGNHDADFEGRNGFWLRRAYLTFDRDLSEELALRLRFETNSAGDFTSANKLEPFVKDLYVRWTREREQVYLGISSTPTWNVIEKIWGYRSVEKTPLDLFKMGSSRDFGVAVKGRFDADGRIRYHAMLGNGSGTRGETNAGKKVFFSLGFYPVDPLVIELYGDYEERPDEIDRTTFQGFAAVQGDWGRVGVMAARQRREVSAVETVNIDIASVFGVFQVHERAALLARYDRTFQPNSDASRISYLPMDPLSEGHLGILGVDVALTEQFHLIPNVEFVVYDREDGTPAPDTDVMVRTTFSVTF